MLLSKLHIEELCIPFKVSFQHSSADRTTTETVLVKAETTTGSKGVGEGCPRSYVTGESINSAIEFFEAYRSRFLQIKCLTDLVDWVKNNRGVIDRNPAAFCAVELAILDVLAQEQDQPVEKLLSLPELDGKFFYTAVLGIRNPKGFETQLNQYIKMGFTDFKVKLFGELVSDNLNLNQLTQHKEKIRIRLDANNLWDNSETAITYLDNLELTGFAIEEPLAVKDYDGMVYLSKMLKLKIILDESFTKLEDMVELDKNKNSWIINLRISKMGGILRSLEIANAAKKAGIPLIIGAQVGETSILTRAALTIANSHKGNIVAQEGAFSTYLLEKDIVDPPIVFGKGGVIQFSS